MGAEKYIQLNTTSGQSDSDVLWNDTAPTNQVFSLGNYSHVFYWKKLLSFSRQYHK